jgi:NAD(P)-dependent dehydrogenase (short-subunit alcohol dehydrogenase family)
MPSDRPLAGRIAVVTGASRGIGEAAAIALARAGAHIIALARTQGALEALDDAIRAATGEGATLAPADITDFDALDRLGQMLYERHGRIDIIVGNAGVLGPLSPLSHIAPKDFERVMAVNVTANYRLIRSLDPLFRRSEAGRAVFVSSGAAARARAFWGAYAASKAALEAMVRSWAGELVNTPHRVNLLDPGPVRTRMRAQAMPGEDPNILPAPSEIARHFLTLTAPELTQTGMILHAPTGTLRSFGPPA